jgi:predicted phage tail protein
VTLRWNASAGASGYVVEAGSRTGSADVGSFAVGGATTYSVDVPPGTFFVRVRGVNAAGISGPSNEIVVQGQGAPNAPTALSASGSGSAVNLRWTAPGGAPPTGYLIEAGSATGLSNLGVLSVGPITTFSTTVPPGTYYVRVRAVNQRGAGPPSNEVVVRR